jgi:hypothetical protein
LQFPDRIAQQFGPYKKACAAQTCVSSKGRIARCRFGCMASHLQP